MGRFSDGIPRKQPENANDNIPIANIIKFSPISSLDNLHFLRADRFQHSVGFLRIEFRVIGIYAYKEAII